MKKILKSIIIGIILLIILPRVVLASTGKIILSGTSTAVIGNRVTVNVTISSNVKIGSWQMNLNYDKNYLQLINSTAEAGGTMMAASSAIGVNKKTYSFTFKTLKKGYTKVSVNKALIYAFDDLSEINFSTNNKSIKIITQAELEASYSKNNNLKFLRVENFELVPNFDPNVLEYNLVVPEDTKEINIVCEPTDKKAHAEGVGIKEVTSGQNTFNIIVRAENGSEKVYKINVEVKDINPIEVILDSKKYTVIKIRENLPLAPFYQENVIKINDFDIPCYTNENTNLTLVGLKNESGVIDLFIYDNKSNSYKKYNELGINKIVIYPLETKKPLPGYTKTKLEINKMEFNGYTLDKNSRFIVIYGINVETGEEGFYTYDKKDQNVMKYNGEYVNILLEKENLYCYIILGFSVIFIIMLFILIFTNIKSKKSRKKSVEKKSQLKKEKNKVNS